MPKRTATPARQRPRHGNCSVPECGRLAYAKGYCQSHHRQFLKAGKTKPIRPYRPRQPGTVKFAGLRLSARCAARLNSYARRRKISFGAAISDVLEGAFLKKRGPRKK